MGVVKKSLTFFGWPLLLLPTAVIYFGIGLNTICTVANGGVMPFRVPNCESKFGKDDDPIHVCMTKQSRMKPLADVITEGIGFVSIGDVLQDIGEAIKKPSYVLWGTIAFFYLVRKKKFYA